MQTDNQIADPNNEKDTGKLGFVVSRHACRRSAQRGIPMEVASWIRAYGAAYRGHPGVIRYVLTKRQQLALAAEPDVPPHLADWFARGKAVCAVVSTESGQLVTLMYVHDHQRRDRDGVRRFHRGANRSRWVA